MPTATRLTRVSRGPSREAPATEPDVCSAKSCTRSATWALLWNNPALHTPERRKVWLACDQHRTSLSDFLAARSFLRDVQPHPARTR